MMGLPEDGRPVIQMRANSDWVQVYTVFEDGRTSFIREIHGLEKALEQFEDADVTQNVLYYRLNKIFFPKYLGAYDHELLTACDVLQTRFFPQAVLRALEMLAYADDPKAAIVYLKESVAHSPPRKIFKYLP